MDYLSKTIFDISVLAVPILLAITCHEVAHGYVAFMMGDPTAKMKGRLTLNPLKHLDPMGTLVFVVTQMIGWAKPVPVNPGYFKRPREDMVWVALAGPIANVIIAVLSSWALKILMLVSSMGFGDQWSFFQKPLSLMIVYSVTINVGLATFNIIPIPPLDGGRILHGLLPYKLAVKYAELERYGFIIVLLLVFSGALQSTLIPLIYFFVGFLI